MIGQVIFYRFINPLILSPEKYFPNFENIGLQQKIHLIRISKVNFFLFLKKYKKYKSK